MTDLALYTVKINGKSYTVAAEDTLGAAIKAAEAFERIEGRDFDVVRDRFEGSFRHKPKLRLQDERSMDGDVFPEVDPA